MIKNEFLAKVYSTPLVRDPDTLKYTLGDKQLDDLFDLGQVSSGFAPSKESVLNFAATTFLYGIAGYKATNYTSVPGGFLVTYQRKNPRGENMVATVLISDDEGIYWQEELAKTIDEVSYYPNYDDAEYSIMHQLSTMMRSESFFKDQMSQCVAFADIINHDAIFMPYIKHNIAQAMFPFSSSKEPQSLNSRNCEENHTLLDMFCAKELGLDYDALVDEAITFEQQGADDKLKQIKEMRNDILHGWILPGYFTFVGNKRGVPTARNAQILNNQKRLAELQQKVKNPKALAAIVNMCATDYSADVVYGILDSLNNEHSQTNDLSDPAKIKSIMPDTPNNAEQVAAIRESFWRKYYAQEQGYTNE